jgi:hypothetical protein
LAGNDVTDGAIEGLLSQAMVIWSAYGQNAFPLQDKARLYAAFGEARGTEIHAVLQIVLHDFEESMARELQAGREDMDAAGLASSQLADKYPSLTDEAIAAVVWCWGYSNR